MQNYRFIGRRDETTSKYRLSAESFIGVRTLRNRNTNTPIHSQTFAQVLRQNSLTSKWVNFPRTGKMVKMWHFQHRRCSSSLNSLRGIHSIHSHILLQSLIKPYSLFPWCSMVFTSTQQWSIVFNSVRSVQQCSIVFNSVQQCLIVFNSV